jgi:hypothetical protein
MRTEIGNSSLFHSLARPLDQLTTKSRVAPSFRDFHWVDDEQTGSQALNHCAAVLVTKKALWVEKLAKLNYAPL